MNPRFLCITILLIVGCSDSNLNDVCVIDPEPLEISGGFEEVIFEMRRGDAHIRMGETRLSYQSDVANSRVMNLDAALRTDILNKATAALGGIKGCKCCGTPDMASDFLTAFVDGDSSRIDSRCPEYQAAWNSVSREVESLIERRVLEECSFPLADDAVLEVVLDGGQPDINFALYEDRFVETHGELSEVNMLQPGDSETIRTAMLDVVAGLESGCTQCGPRDRDDFLVFGLRVQGDDRVYSIEEMCADSRTIFDATFSIFNAYK